MTPHRAGFEGRFDAIGWQLVRAVMRAKPLLRRGEPRLLDLGMGRGRDLIYFARRGFRVLGVDRRPEGIEKARRRAARLRVSLRTQVGDLRRWRAPGAFDVVFSSMSLNHLPPSCRGRRLAHFQAHTAPGGIHAVNVFVTTPHAPPPPDLDPGALAFRPGELVRLYLGWELIDFGTREYACGFGGSPHRHRVEFVVARKPARSSASAEGSGSARSPSRVRRSPRPNRD